MKDRSEIGIVAATTRYEAWLSERIPLVKPDLELKHHAMSAGIFPFLRATFYRWAGGASPRAARDGAVSPARSGVFLAQARVASDGAIPHPRRRAGLAPTGPPRARTQGEDRPSRRRTREPGAPAVRRARRVAWGAGRAGGQGTRSLGREDPLSRDPAPRRSLSRSVRQGGRC